MLIKSHLNIRIILKIWAIRRISSWYLHCSSCCDDGADDHSDDMSGKLCDKQVAEFVLYGAHVTWEVSQNMSKQCQKVQKKRVKKGVPEKYQKSVWKTSVPKKCPKKVSQSVPGTARYVQVYYIALLASACRLYLARHLSTLWWLFLVAMMRWCDAVKLTWTVQRHLWSPSMRFPARRNKARCLQCIL